MSKWSHELLQKEALKYATKYDFMINNKNAYRAAYRKGILEKITSHITNKKTKWTEVLIASEAIKYTSRAEFQKNSCGAYTAARTTFNILDEVCSHMIHINNTWDYDNLHKEAIKYTTRKEFSNNNKKAYEAAYHKNILNDICSHMDSKIIYWTDDELRIEALKYNTRWEFGKNNKSAYQAAHKRNIMDSICAHMVNGIGGFNPDKPGILYYIRFDSDYDLPIYKIGITNLATNDRIKSMVVNEGYTATILKEFYFEDGKECYELEKLYHTEFKEHLYYGEPILNNGNTELYNIDVLNLDSIYNQ